MFNYGLGGQEVKQDASEGFTDLPLNRTMFVQKLTNDDPVKPEIVQDLKTVEEVFDHFQPNVDVEFTIEEGGTAKENLRFKNLGDFGKKGITAQSKFLKELDVKQQQYLNLIKKVKSVKALKTLLDDKEGKDALINSLKAAAQELESADSQ